MVKGSDTSTFWQKATQTPLTEHYDAHHKRVTFLWRGAKANAYILGTPSGQHDPMAQLNGTDIWFRSYIVPSDALSQYKIAPDIPQIDAAIPGARRKALLSTAQADPGNLRSAGAEGADKFNRYSILAPDTPGVCDFRDPGKQLLSGSVTLHIFTSNILNNQREIAIYTPPSPGA